MLTMFRKNFRTIPLEQESFGRGIARAPLILKVGQKFDGKKIFVLDEEGSLLLDFEKLAEIEGAVSKKINFKFIFNFLRAYKEFIQKFEEKSKALGEKTERKSLENLLDDLNNWLEYNELYVPYPMSTKFLPRIVEGRIRENQNSYSPQELEEIIVIDKSPALELACDSLQLYIDFKKGNMESLKKFVKKYTGTGPGDIEAPKYHNRETVTSMLKSAYSHLTVEEAEKELESIRKTVEEKTKKQKALLKKAPEELRTLITFYWELQKMLDNEGSVWSRNCHYGYFPLLKKLAQELVNMDIIVHPEDVFMIKQSELPLLGKTDLKKRIAERKSKHCELARLGGVKHSEVALRRVIS